MKSNTFLLTSRKAAEKLSDRLDSTITDKEIEELAYLIGKSKTYTRDRQVRPRYYWLPNEIEELHAIIIQLKQTRCSCIITNNE